MRHSVWLAALVLAALPAGGFAQVPESSLDSGDRVRFELGDDPAPLPDKGEGTYLSSSVAAITLSEIDEFDSDGPIDLPRELIRELEVTRGEEDVRWFGGIVGAAAGLALGVSMALDDGDQEAPIFLGPLIGGAAGYMLGSLIRSPNWVDVRLAQNE